MRIAEISASYGKYGSRKTMMTSFFRNRNMAVSRMRNEKYAMQYKRYYRNSSVIVDLAMEQIPRST